MDYINSLNGYDILVFIDKAADRVPFFSSITNMVDLFIKANMSDKAQAPSQSDRYYTHIKDKSPFRCILLLIPIFGNIVVALIDYNNYRKYSNSSQKVQSDLDYMHRERAKIANIIRKMDHQIVKFFDQARFKFPQVQFTLMTVEPIVPPHLTPKPPVSPITNNEQQTQPNVPPMSEVLGADDRDASQVKQNNPESVVSTQKAQNSQEPKDSLASKPISDPYTPPPPYDPPPYPLEGNNSADQKPVESSQQKATEQAGTPNYPLPPPYPGTAGTETPVVQAQEDEGPPPAYTSKDEGIVSVPQDPQTPPPVYTEVLDVANTSKEEELAPPPYHDSKESLQVAEKAPVEAAVRPEVNAGGEVASAA